MRMSFSMLDSVKAGFSSVSTIVGFLVLPDKTYALSVTRDMWQNLNRPSLGARIQNNDVHRAPFLEQSVGFGCLAEWENR